MTTDQMNHLSMYDAVSLHASTFQTITDTVPGFKNSIDALDLKIVVIRESGGAQTRRITGIATSKDEIRIVLTNITFRVISPVKGYAATINDSDLQEQMAFAKSTLDVMADQELLTTAQDLIGIVTLIGAPLLDFGITPAILTAWQAAIDDFQGALATPRQAIVHRSTLTDELVVLFKEASDILSDISDPTAESFKEDEPHYYNDYFKARKLLDLGTGTTRLKGVVAAAETGEPLFDALITINELGVTTQCDVDGNYLFSPVPRGTYTLTVSLAGWESQTSEPFELVQGTTVTTDFALVQLA